jgi:hypothetical protein
MKKHPAVIRNNRFKSNLKIDLPVFQVGPSLDFTTIATALAAAYLDIQTNETIVLEFEPGHTYTWTGAIASSHNYTLRTLGGITSETTNPAIYPFAPPVEINFSGASLNTFAYDGIIAKKSFIIQDLHVTGDLEIPWGWDVEVLNSDVNNATFNVDSTGSTAGTFHGTTLRFSQVDYVESLITVNNQGNSAYPVFIAFYNCNINLGADAIVGDNANFDLAFYTCAVLITLTTDGATCINLSGSSSLGFHVNFQFCGIILATSDDNVTIITALAPGAGTNYISFTNSTFAQTGNQIWNTGVDYFQDAAAIPIIAGLTRLPADFVAHPFPPGTIVQDTMNVDALGITNSARSWNSVSWIPHQVQLGDTASRPILDLQSGDQYFDTTLSGDANGLPIWWNGTAWITASGGGTVGAVTVITSVDSPYTPSVGETILADTTGGAILLTLPAAATFINAGFTVKKISTDINTVTIDPNGAEEIDNELTYIFNVAFQSMVVVSDKVSAWYLL